MVESPSNTWGSGRPVLHLLQVAIAEPLAKPGETVVSPSIQQILGALGAGDRRGSLLRNALFAPSDGGFST